MSVFSSEKDDVKIPWNEEQRLTWSDFRGTPERLGDFVASTNSGISFSYGYTTRNGVTEVTHSVTCNFYPELSWYLPERVSPYILKHEQAHFDISELHARKLRKRMSGVTFSPNVKSEMEALYHQVEKERRKMQSDFDEQTDHSKMKDAEEEWELFVANQLDMYDDWK